MIDFFKGASVDPSADDREINVLVSDSGDLRHCLKSLMDLVDKSKPARTFKINVSPVSLSRFTSMKKQRKTWPGTYCSSPSLTKQPCPCASAWNCSLIYTATWSSEINPASTSTKSQSKFLDWSPSTPRAPQSSRPWSTSAIWSTTTETISKTSSSPGTPNSLSISSKPETSAWGITSQSDTTIGWTWSTGTISSALRSSRRSSRAGSTRSGEWLATRLSFGWPLEALRIELWAHT